jgi:hypothetical protein
VAKLVCSGCFCWGYETHMCAYGTNGWFYWCYVSLHVSKCQEPIYSAISKCVEPIYAFVCELCSVMLSSIVPTICSELFPCLGLNSLVHDRKDYWNQGIHEIGIIRKW